MATGDAPTGMNNSVVWNIVRSEGETIPIKVERSG
jgi:hypothetical protein